MRMQPVAILLVALIGSARSGEAPADLKALAGTEADIAPSAYAYRADRAPAGNPPETEFLFSAIGHRREGVLCGLLWEAPRPVVRVEVCRSAVGAAVPRPEVVVVRWSPHGDSSSWWSRRAMGGGPASIATAKTHKVAGGGRTYIYAVELPACSAPAEVLLRLRHPTSAPIQGVTVNGKAFADFDAAREVVRLRGLTGAVTVEVTY